MAERPTKADVYVDSINVNVELLGNGDIWVTDTQSYIFRGSSDIDRAYAVGANKADDIAEITINENDKPISFSVARESDRLWIYWKHESSPVEKRALVLRYRVIGGVRVGSETDELLWTAIPRERELVVQNARVTVLLPEALEGRFKVTFPPQAVQIGPRTIGVSSDGPLSPGHALEISVVFPHDVLDIPKPLWELRKTIYLSLLVAALFIISAIFYFGTKFKVLAPYPLLWWVGWFRRPSDGDRRSGGTADDT